MAAPNPDEMVFSDDPAQSPSATAMMIIKQLTDRGVTPNAGNIRRALEANARGTDVAGPDVLEGVRNNVVENSAPAVAAPRRAGLPVPPVPPEQAGPPELNGPPTVPSGPTASTGIGGLPGSIPGGLGALIAAAAPILYGLRNQFGGGGAPVPAPTGGAPTTSAAPTPAPAAGPIPGARTGASGAAPPIEPVPPPPPAPAQPTNVGPIPGARPGNLGVTTPPPVGVPSPPPAPVAPPAAAVPPPPAGPTVGTSPTLRGIPPSAKALQDILTRNKLGVGKFGAGIPFIVPEAGDSVAQSAINTVRRFGVGGPRRQQ